MIEEKIDHCDLKEIAESGQCFRWKKLSENKYSVIAFDKKLEIEDLGKGLFGFDCTEEEFENTWKDYLDLGTDYSHVERLIMDSGDNHLKEAFKSGSGIRILKQDLFEMLVSYLISQNNNIPRIKGSIEAICKKGGFKAENCEDEYRLPKWYEVRPDFFDDRSLGLGYRVPYLMELYEFLSKNPDWLSYLKTLDYETARAELLKRKGIGPKVSDCVCLFSLHHIDAFPIDTHVKQLLLKYYADGFNYDYYKGYAGIIQQYLFFFELNSGAK